MKLLSLLSLLVATTIFAQVPTLIPLFNIPQCSYSYIKGSVSKQPNGTVNAIVVATPSIKVTDSLQNSVIRQEMYTVVDCDHRMNRVVTVVNYIASGQQYSIKVNEPYRSVDADGMSTKLYSIVCPKLRT